MREHDLWKLNKSDGEIGVMCKICKAKSSCKPGVTSRMLSCDEYEAYIASIQELCQNRFSHAFPENCEESEALGAAEEIHNA